MADDSKSAPVPVEASAASAASLAAPHPPSFVEIIQMIQSGQEPTDIRKDIDDSARVDAVPSASVLPRRPKPWEKKAAAEAEVDSSAQSTADTAAAK